MDSYLKDFSSQHSITRILWLNLNPLQVPSITGWAENQRLLFFARPWFGSNSRSKLRALLAPREEQCRPSHLIHTDLCLASKRPLAPLRRRYHTSSALAHFFLPQSTQWWAGKTHRGSDIERLISLSAFFLSSARYWTAKAAAVRKSLQLTE